MADSQGSVERPVRNVADVEFFFVAGMTAGGTRPTVARREFRDWLAERDRKAAVERDALRAEVERLREGAGRALVDRDAYRAELDEARQQVADLRAGIEALIESAPAEPHAIEPQYTPVVAVASLRALLAESGEQPGERARCSECGPGYRVGDEGCRHRPAPVVPDSADVRERVWQALRESRRNGLGGMTEAQALDHMTDAVLAVVGQGVTVEWGVGYGDRHEAAPSREDAEEWIADDDAWNPGEERWLVTRQVGPWTRAVVRPSGQEGS